MPRSRHLLLLAALVALVLTGCGDDSAQPAATQPEPETTTTTSTTTTLPFIPPGGVAGAFTELEAVVGESPFELPATIRLPDDASEAEPVPGVVIVGDFGPQDEDGTVLARKPLRDLGEGLADRGVATITYPKRMSAHQEALTEAPLGVAEETVDDAVSALGVLAETPGVDGSRLFVVGHGVGGMLSPLVAEAARAAEVPEDVAGLVVLASPARPFEEARLDEVRYLAEIDGGLDEEDLRALAQVGEQVERIRSGDLSPDTPAGEALGMSGAWWLDLRDHDVTAAVVESDRRALVLLAGRDQRVFWADVERWREAADGAEAVTLVVGEDLDHLLVAGEGPSTPQDYARSDRVEPWVLDEVAEWILS